MPEYTDFYRLRDELSEEEHRLREMVRAFVVQKYLPILAEHYEAGSFPLEIGRELGKLGLLGMKYEGYGCAGATSTDYGLVCEQLEWADSGLRSFMSVQTSLVIHPIHTWGSEEQKRRYIPKLASGELIGCYGLTEPDHGSDPGAMITRAVRDGGHYVLSGAKMWITNATIADLAVVWAKCDDTVAGFLVERGTPGFTTVETKGKLSLRASVTGELVFDECRIPAANRLPDAAGLRAPLSCLNEARFGICWGAMGAAAACYESALAYTRERTQFERPIASFQLTQEKLVWMLAEITAGQLLNLRLGRMKDAGRTQHWHVSLAKYKNVSAALEIARAARGLHGASGITLEYPPLRHAANLESVLTYEGTHEIHALVVGRQITGEDAFR
ncbi:MAG: acyl-CoA dehydrogenase [Candidatus Eisenbacteria bacterium]|nr:acyl-CoA dehydrogenase [Candidatus Eisenbacteria bacterium]